MHGIFVYQISKEDIRKVSLVQFISFAQINPSKPPEIKRFDFVPGELNTDCATLGYFEDVTYYENI